MARDGKVWQGMARASKYSASERLISVISVLSSSKANCQSLLAAQAERVAEQWKLFTSSWRLCLGLSKFQYKCGTYVVLTVDVFGIGFFFLFCYCCYSCYCCYLPSLLDGTALILSYLGPATWLSQLQFCFSKFAVLCRST